MSLSWKLIVLAPPRFPRVSGDEPHVQKIWATLPMFSPRERG